MKSAELKKTLEGFEKMELIRLIIELAKLKKYNMEWLEIEFQKPDEPPELLEYYKKKISRALDSNDLTAGKKAIRDFKKALPSRESLIVSLSKIRVKCTFELSKYNAQSWL
jgi:hypothetical protein